MSSTVGRVFAFAWAVSHALQYGLAITGLNGISDAVTCADKPAGYIPTKGWVTPCVPMDSTRFGFVVSIFTVGGLIGSLSSDYVARKTGRIGTFRVAAFAILIGSVAVGLGASVPAMLFGRVVIGLGCGIATATVPVFLAEIAPPSIRQALGITNQLFIVVGLLTGQALSLPLAKETIWRWVFAVSFFLAIAQLIGSLFVKTPGSSDGEEEQPLLPSEEPMSIRELLTSQDPVIRRGLVVVIITQLAQQACGISPVMYFSTRILKPVFSANSRMVALAVVAWKIPLTILPAFVIERAGSKPILLVSSGFMAISALLLAIGLNANSGPLSATSIVSFVSFFSIGLGPVVWVVLSQVMPPQARTAAGAIGIALNWTANGLISSAFLPLQQWLSRDGKYEGNIFYIFAVSCTVVFIAIRQSYAAFNRAKTAD
ncbi:putative vacuolar membrane protein [Kockovaella imperatae]|uniref:Putative vacuolar membrane protein n=1 Tax=Kockovaella imperatae TaxID=4999 RepID=A0A1Y1UDE7_9TREE|nr:putative vacuolar membrane protein [Kockovaella imperatae]ORX36061.1 putative vacuolar membrane protein [Kockovaella imperatae]